MKLKNFFETMKLDESIIAIPVGESAGSFKGVLKMNSSAKEIVELLFKDTSENEICSFLVQKYPDQAQEIPEYVKDVILKLRNDNLLEE